MYYKLKQPLKIDKKKLFFRTVLCDQDTIHIIEVFGSLFIVCSPRWSITVPTGFVSCVCLALGVSNIQWSHWQS